MANISMRHTAFTVSLSLAVLAFASRSAHAGDPCPIHIPVVNLGLPDWANDALKAKVKDGDAFLAKLVAAAKNDDQCTTTELLDGSGRIFPTPPYDVTGSEDKLKTTFIKAALIDKKKRFRCDAAAKDLKHLKGLAEASGSLVYYRGHSRVLLVVPGWSSTCVSAKKADKMTDKQVRALVVKLTKKLVADRHANP